MIWQYVLASLILLGSFFSLVAAIGTYRFPDPLSRLHAATKAGAFGAGFLLLAATLHFADGVAAIQCLVILAFFYLTAPIAAKALGKATSDPIVSEELAESVETEGPAAKPEPH